MRVLFVAPYLPTPGSGGRTRLINLMERHAERHDVSLVALAPDDQDPAEVPYPGQILPYPPRRRDRGPAGTVAFYRERFAQPLPMYAYHARLPALGAALREEIEARRPDLVQFEHPETGQYLSSVPAGPLRVMDFHDVPSRWMGRGLLKSMKPRQRAFLALELAKTRRLEARIARATDLNIVCSELERDQLREVSGVEAVVASNGVDTHAFAPMPSVVEEPSRLLYVGPLTYEANIDAMRWFSGHILPLILAEMPDAALDIVGIPKPDEHFSQAVRQLGKVPDVRVELARAPVSVVPIRIGSGTRYKILEALAMERAIVSTTVGAEGLGVRDGEHVLIADEPETFARAVLALLRSPEERRRLGVAGRALVAKRYDWGPIVELIEASWDTALESRRRATTR